jgi:hypothetical protein
MSVTSHQDFALLITTTTSASADLRVSAARLPFFNAVPAAVNQHRGVFWRSSAPA